MTFYRRNLPHLQRDFRFHFLTFCTRQRRFLPGWARDIVLNACIRADGNTVDLHVAAVMPDHVHLIFTPRTDVAKSEVFTLARITHGIKSPSSHLINGRLGATGSIWQEESFDRVLRSSDKLDEKIEYILQNPVRKNLVQLPQEYPWLWVSDRYSHLLSSPQLA
jgi:REP element-mobilizing transposase RayT